MFEKACKTLRVGGDATPDEVRKAFVKMVRRYPPEHFPDRFIQLRKAQEQLNLEKEFVTDRVEEAANVESPREFVSFWFKEAWGESGSFLNEIPEDLDMQLFASMLSEEENRVKLDAAVAEIAAEGVEMLE